LVPILKCAQPFDNFTRLYFDAKLKLYCGNLVHTDFASKSTKTSYDSVQWPCNVFSGSSSSSRSSSSKNKVSP